MINFNLLNRFIINGCGLELGSKANETAVFERRLLFFVLQNSMLGCAKNHRKVCGSIAELSTI